MATFSSHLSGCRALPLLSSLLSGWTAQWQSGKFSWTSTVRKKKIKSSFLMLSSCKAKPEWWITSFRTDIYRFFRPTAQWLKKKIPQMFLCIFSKLLVFQVTPGHLAGAEVKSCPDLAEAQMGKVFLFCMLCMFVIVQRQCRRDKRRTKQGKETKGRDGATQVLEWSAVEQSHEF